MAVQKELSLSGKSGYAREVSGLFLFFWAVFLVLSLISFDRNDPTLNHVMSAAEIRNKAGLFGAYVAGFLNEWFGLCSFLWPLFFVAIGLPCFSSRFVLSWRCWLGSFMLILVFMESCAAMNILVGDFSPAGILGNGLYQSTVRFLNPLGALLFWTFLFLVAVQVICNVSWITLISRLKTFIQEKRRQWKEARSAVPSSPILQTQPADAGAGQHEEGLLSRIISLLGRETAFARRRRRNLQRPLDDPFLSDPVRPLVKLEDENEDDDPLNTDRRKRRQTGKHTASGNTSADTSSDVSQDTSQDTSRDLSSDVPLTREQEPQDSRPSEQTAPDVRSVLTGAQESGEPGTETPGDGQEAPEDVSSGTEENQTRTDQTQDAGKKPSSFARGALKRLFSRKDPREEQTPQAPARESAPSRPGRASSLDGPFPFPPYDLLDPPVHVENREDMQQKGQILMNTLKEFGIEGQLTSITPGPVVTLFEVIPAKGVSVSRFRNIGNDLARVLMAQSVSVMAPVPGSNTVGIEIPNAEREIVSFRELVSTRSFQSMNSPLPMVLGKDITGSPFYADLSRMPHLLIAGATGAGKSVCLNSILVSLLYHTQPKDVKLLLVDPKRVEMSVYADEPHLMHPVITEPQDVKDALSWIIDETQRRFTDMSRLGVRTIQSFNNRLSSFGGNRPDDIADLQPFPYIAIVIDELADLMVSADKHEVEERIVRIAQIARACGIHMIIATQRPSVDVVTGLIKANFPSRISFKVFSNSDSRTILDTQGAERLLGRGDMLYKYGGEPVLRRLHGAFLSDDETARVVDYWKGIARPDYQVFETRSSSSGGSGSGGSAETDELHDEIWEFVQKLGVASISRIQRQFGIGYNRAARIVESFDEEGLLTPPEGNRPRKVRKQEGSPD